MEAHTDGLAAAWDLFRTLEGKGGLAEALEQGWWQSEIAAARDRRAKDIATRKEPLTGTSEFPILVQTMPEVLAPALTLLNAGSIHQADPVAAVRYVHFVLDDHHIVRSEGALSESFFPTTLSLAGVAPKALAELLHLFPEIFRLGQAFAHTARPVVKAKEAWLLAG